MKLKVQMAFAQIGPEIKCSRVPFEGRGVVQKLVGQYLNRGLLFSMVLPWVSQDFFFAGLGESLGKSLGENSKGNSRVGLH